MIRLILILTLSIMTTLSQAQNQDTWAEYMTPTEIHNLFSQYIGNFTMEMTVGTGSSKPTMFMMYFSNQMLLGGRFLEMKQLGYMMGMDYQSIITFRFNTTDKQISLTILTNIGTGTLSMFGE